MSYTVCGILSLVVGAILYFGSEELLYKVKRLRRTRRVIFPEMKAPLKEIAIILFLVVIRIIGLVFAGFAGSCFMKVLYN